jgi:hypothetical protein
MSDIRWEDPPPIEKHTDWAEQLLPLMDHPKRWAMITSRARRDNAASVAMSLRNGRSRTPPGRWEFASRSVDGEFRVYARYLGPDDEATS